jgi:hypothetical protein
MRVGIAELLLTSIAALRSCIPQDIMSINLPVLNDNLWLVAVRQEFDRLSTVLAGIKTDLRMLVTMGAAASCDALKLRYRGREGDRSGRR